MAAHRIAVPGQNLAQTVQIFGGFEAVEVIRRFTELNTGCPELLPALAIADADTSPVIALKKQQWPIKTEAVGR